MPKFVSDPLIKALYASGIADSNTRRVVIDIQAGHAAIIHTERYGDSELLDVLQTLNGVEITRKEAN
jgi:hypothetical protein